jgi:hypothetical protein
LEKLGDSHTQQYPQLITPCKLTSIFLNAKNNVDFDDFNETTNVDADDNIFTP